MVIAIIMISVADSGQLVRFFIFSVWLFHGTAMLALIVLRVKNKDKVRPYKVRLSESCPFLILMCFLPPQRLFLSACAYLKNILILRFVPSVCVWLVWYRHIYKRLQSRGIFSLLLCLPGQVNLVLPVVVVLIIAFLLIGPFLRSPNPEFISSLVLVGLSLLCYLPMHWFYSRATLPGRSLPLISRRLHTTLCPSRLYLAVYLKNVEKFL